MDESIPPAPAGGDDPLPDEVAPPSQTDGPLLFGRYRVLRELGRGGMGVVHLAHDEELHLDVALKLIPDLVVQDAEAIDDLKKEVLRGRALTHPGIVRTHDFARDATSAAIVMEYIEGWTLADLKAQQPDRCFDPADILPWLEQLCPILDYAHHTAKIAHRDLKPRNLMLTAAGRVKVADFGIASSLSDSQSRVSLHGNTSGTPPYMSPQQLQGGRPSHLDDLYALGALLYELLTSKPPFFRGNIPSQVIGQPPPTMAARREELGIAGRAAISPMWEEAVAACLAKEPEDRPQSAGEFLHRLKTPPYVPPVAMTPQPPPRPSPNTLRRRAAKAAASRRAWTWGVGIAVIAFAAITSWLGTRESEGLALKAATKEHPFINSLGMKFVPVPIKGGPTDGKHMLFCVWDTRVKDFAAFVDATGHDATKGMVSLEVEGKGVNWKQAGRTWKSPGFAQTGEHPVVGVSWEDARFFCAWITKIEHASGRLPAGYSYRLPKDHEWSCAVGNLEKENPKTSTKDKNAKINGVYPWGTAKDPPLGFGNYTGEESKKGMPPDWGFIAGYTDGFPRTSPVGSFKENRVGLYDMGGNVWQWCDDSDQKSGVLRGASWCNFIRERLLSSFRLYVGPGNRHDDVGFRCVVARSGE